MVNHSHIVCVVLGSSVVDDDGDDDDDVRRDVWQTRPTMIDPIGETKTKTILEKTIV